MMYTVIVYEKVSTLGGCHRWISEFSLKKCGLHSEIQRQLVSTCMHVCGPMILPTIGLCNL